MQTKKQLIEEKEESDRKALSYRARLMKITDLVDEYKKDEKNIFTVMRDITNIVKGWE